MAKKAAVVIGVDQVGNLAKLKSAATSAEMVAAWLKSEDYEVTCLVDKSKPVTSWEVEEAVSQYVTLPARYRLLVVYFSGHGYWHARSDIWLLSRAPTHSSQAINLNGAMDCAKYSGIPNVVFISDACRSIPNSRADAMVNGIYLFPNFAEFNRSSKVDFFKATSEAQAAYEGNIDGERHSVLTYALMSAYQEPIKQIVREVIEDGKSIRVVPNRQLESYLQNKVNDILANIDSKLTQTIEANVPSSEETYLARVHVPITLSTSGTRSGVSGAPIPTPLNIGLDATNTILDILNTNVFELEILSEVPLSHPNTEAAINSRLPDTAIDHIEFFTGFTISGAKVIKVVTPKTHNNTWAELLMTESGNDTAFIRLSNVARATSVVVQLENGYCAVLAALEGYIGHANFDTSGLVNVSYVPSQGHWLRRTYEGQKNLLDRMRALIALAIENNTFRLYSAAEARALGIFIRMGKSIDPTLGLYSAHAYSQAGNDEFIETIREYMLGDLGVDLFDIRVLISRKTKEYPSELPIDVYPVIPFCPMLTQTWNLLRPRGIQLPPVLEEAKPYLCNSLWTMFEPQASESIISAIESGELN